MEAIWPFPDKIVQARDMACDMEWRFAQFVFANFQLKPSTLLGLHDTQRMIGDQQLFKSKQ